MKYIYFMLAVFFMSVPFAFADTDHGNFTQAQAIIEQRIPYDQLTDDQFEILGDYFMELMVGERHDFMDEMMGGEGSESLRQAHINMGRNLYTQYLEDGTLQNSCMGGVNMMDGTQNYGYNMMYPGTSSFFWGIGLLGFLGMLLFWGLIIWLIYWLITQTTSKQKSARPEDILKKRLAKGEITKKEYDELRKKLSK